MVLLTTVIQQAQSVAIGWDLYERTGSALALGWVGLAQFMPVILLFLPAGQLADQFDRRWIVVLSLVVWGGSNLLLAAVSMQNAPVGWFYVAAVGIGAAQVVNRPRARRADAATRAARDARERSGVEREPVRDRLDRWPGDGRRADRRHRHGLIGLSANILAAVAGVLALLIERRRSSVRSARARCGISSLGSSTYGARR